MRTRSYLVGTSVGAGLAVGLAAAQRAFGATPEALIPVALAFIGGAFAGVRRMSRISERTAFIVLAVLVALSPFFSDPTGRLVAWVGGGLGASPIVLGLARAIVGSIVLVPAGYCAGSIVSSAVASLGASPTGASSAASAIAGAWIGFFGAYFAALLPRGPTIAAIGGGIALCAGAKLIRARRGNAGRTPSEPDASEEIVSTGLSPGLIALGIGFAGAAWSVLAPRLMSFPAGAELTGFPITQIALFASCAAGALAAAFLEPVRGASPGARMAAGALVVASLAVLGLWTRFDELMPRFAEVIASKPSMKGLVAFAFRTMAPPVGAAGLLLGFASASLAADLASPHGRRTRSFYILAGGASIGWIAGCAFLGGELPEMRLDKAIRVAALGPGILAVAGLFTIGRITLVRTLVSVGGILALFLAARVAPSPDRAQLLIERDLIPASALYPIAQKSWMSSDEDGRAASYAVVRRGHARRLLVNGRFEVSNESVKTQGLVAHLPLLMHPEPRRVIVLGSGNALALDAALSHPVERVECFETERAAVRATARMGIEAERALRDGRVAIRLGDFGDLLARAEPADVIVSQVSGVWGDRAASVTTIEFLELVKSRLTERGNYCIWVPDAAVTKEGILILMATLGRAFPEVQAWAGQGGDLLLLARRSNAPIDAAQIVERFRTCGCLAATQRAWVEEPVTFLASFLASDATLRRISSSAPIHTRAQPRLGREEAARRRVQEPVNPVPGLEQLGDDVLASIVGSPGPGFETAVRNAIQARALEREATDLEDAKRPFEAIEVFQRALEMNPRDGSVRRSFAMMRTRLGILYAGDQSLTAAHNNFRAAVETDTTYAQGFANLGSLVMQLGPPEYALATTHQALLLEPDDDLAWVQLGIIERGVGSLDEAIADFEKAMTLNPSNVEAAMEWVDARVEAEESPDLAAAVEFLEGYLALEPENEGLIYRIGKYRDAQRLRTGAEAEGS